MSKNNKLDKHCEFSNCKNKDVMIGQQIHCYAKNASKKSDFLHTLPMYIDFYQ